MRLLETGRRYEDLEIAWNVEGIGSKALHEPRLTLS